MEQDKLSRYFAWIGRKGGKSRSERKLRAIKANLAKANAAKRLSINHRPKDKLPECEAALHE